MEDYRNFVDFADDILQRSVCLRNNNSGDIVGIEAAIMQVDMVNRMCIDLIQNGPNGEDMRLRNIILRVEVEHGQLRDILETETQPLPSQFAVEVSYTGRRPKIVLDPEDLLMLRLEKFTIPEISRLVGVSERTVKRRCQEAGISDQVVYSDLSDEELDTRVRDIVANFPSMGYRMIWDQLSTNGVLVHRERVRSAVHRVDPLGINQRFSALIPRRKYNVRGPNALWHIDGNHKLIRWGFVIHGGIDGFTRMIVFLRCSTNNRAETVLEGFKSAIEQFGCPARVRTDHGGENIGVGRLMFDIMGELSRPFITGPSTHNQRIERLWKDLNRVVNKLFRSIFLAMENDSLLNVSDPLQLLALQYVFIQRIQRNLDTFATTWNSHKLSTEGMKTPRQLWILGASSGGVSGIGPMNMDPAVNEFYGIDPEGPLPAQEIEAVELNDIHPLYQTELEILHREVDPDIDDSNYGIDVFLAAKAALNLYS